MTYLAHYIANWDKLREPFRFRRLVCKWGGDCWYCGQPIARGIYCLYAPEKVLAHVDCEREANMPKAHFGFDFDKF